MNRVPEKSQHANEIGVVEDDIEVSRAISTMLDHLGYIPVPFSRAQEAMDYLQTQEIGLMLVDYRMPDMTGLDLIRMMQEMNRKIPVVMMTGFPATEERISAENLGKITVLRKPIEISRLAQAVSDALKPSIEFQPVRNQE